MIGSKVSKETCCSGRFLYILIAVIVFVYTYLKHQLEAKHSASHLATQEAEVAKSLEPTSSGLDKATE